MKREKESECGMRPGGAYGQMAGPNALRDPLWGTAIVPSAAETKLLRTNALRRLHFVRHAGPAALHTQHTSSRLQHTLGVFALIAHFAPDWPELRAAALLHDVGHGPFSHALEGIGGFDHHRRSEEVLHSPEIRQALDGLNATEVFDLIQGLRPNPLRNGERVLHADHLDSWVRSAASFGILPKPAPELLRGYRLSGSSYLEADQGTAELTLRLIVHEAEYHASADNIGPVAVLRALTLRLIEAGGLLPDRLGDLADEGLLHVLRQHPATAAETARLLERPHELAVVRRGEPAPEGAYPHRLNKLYLAMPRVAGGLRADELPSYARIAGLSELLGDYAVFWREEGEWA
ncbi:MULTISPECIES: HD domain-containing protein [Saccharibacillus]|uniref:HD domain-containing protein n=1 Tax=Saccharibacillus TaxID=456492 RepID=UPI00123AFE14|nr:HD domain-containing protein [Saccharibacillus sp. WB 17]MWJ33100.1 HD domain-containing protein [Saccharibacillus sp. WB 17]